MSHFSSEFSSDSSLSGSQFIFHVKSEQAGCRLDHFLVRAVPETSRSVLTESVRLGLIKVDNLQRKSSYCLKAGECIAGSLFVTPVMDLLPEEIPFDVLFEDSYLLILSKPPGLVVHPGSGNFSGTLVNGLLYHCKAIAGVGGDVVRPGIVHRLDKDTSGLMVVAKEEVTHRKLVDAFKARIIEKQYLALVHGILKKKAGRIVASIGRHPVHRQKMAIREDGRYAATNWQVLQEFSSGLSLVRLQIETGRTHQIRVHMASMGHPVAGDMVYSSGHGKRKFPRQLLHSSHLRFVHPVTGEKLFFSAPLWPDFSLIVDQLADETKQDMQERL
ncbi:MAG: RluA family pseudouridine synthase [Proteobacteria bacterium]|jgi:23S rRNA pseudouridine1911/1915/1917 synthase|nr:RluA family pseudouridine synthase [Desulfocapsa sp.]MBU3945633.1 RluA family pseudouridine synthase [Pseudomonadota bacterium]MCG2745878.1 RluA family pseudouridine synthase [Desulfobacteraceae bacterium]MBU4029675.1 RluA family pseudouridine synthase [Pseudomonadota bacterium]MBU4043472.1 RluA family pseudouridine synthase [Pseudomonadota bacterium]